MFNAAVRDGDATTTGGRVSGSGFPADGRNVTLDGDEATCGECPGRYLIRGSRHGVIVDGRAMVMEGDSVLCPCGKNTVRASFAGVVFAEKPTERQEHGYRTRVEGASHLADNEHDFGASRRNVTTDEVHLYDYKDLNNITREELFVWISIDKILEQFTGTDIAAAAAILSGQPFLPTRGKFGGATPGTSPASIISRKYLNKQLAFRLPMITGKSLSTLRIALTRNLGAFVGRAVPIVGWMVMAYDVEEILRNTLTTYNQIAIGADKIW